MSPVRRGERPTLSITDLGDIAKYCRNLRSLGLDIQCDEHWWVCLKTPRPASQTQADGICSHIRCSSISRMNFASLSICSSTSLIARKHPARSITLLAPKSKRYTASRKLGNTHGRSSATRACSTIPPPSLHYTTPRLS